MKVLLLGRNADDLIPILDRHGIERVTSDDAPELIIAHGGDGALIGAEREHPGIPKIGIRDNRNCQKCEDHEDAAVIERLVSGETETTQLMKLSAVVDSRTFLGVNDVFLRNADIRSAVRFSVYVNEERVTDEIIGDGLVASTPFGSSAYFRSITNTVFRTGIGIAFNNCTEILHHFVLSESDEVRVHIVRGPAEITSDNCPETGRVEDSDDIVIRRHEETAAVIAVDTLRCSFCRYRHAPRRRF